VALVVLGYGLAYTWQRSRARAAAALMNSEEMLMARRVSMSRRPPPFDLPAPLAPDLVPLSGVGQLLAAVVDDDPPGVVLALREGGQLDQYSFPDCVLRRRYRLDQPGYRAVFDRSRGLLYVAATHPGALAVNRYGDPPAGKGDLHIYKIGPLRDRVTDTRLRPAGVVVGPLAAVADASLRPDAVIPLDGSVSHLRLAPGGQAVYFLLHRPDGGRVGRVVAGAQTATFFHHPEGLSALTLSPEDGRTLYAAGPGGILVLDAATLTRRQTLATDVQVCDLSVDRTGRLFLAEQGSHPLVTVLETRRGAPVAQWLSPVSGRNYLCVTPDGVRVYLSTSALVGSSLRSLKVAGNLVHEPQHVASAAADLSVPVRGEFFYFPESKCIVTRTGRVFRLSRTDTPPGEKPRIVRPNLVPAFRR
jgi:hypothetical protein